jgi:hypothetical protein
MHPSPPDHLPLHNQEAMDDFSGEFRPFSQTQVLNVTKESADMNFIEPDCGRSQGAVDSK